MTTPDEIMAQINSAVRSEEQNRQAAAEAQARYEQERRAAAEALFAEQSLLIIETVRAQGVAPTNVVVGEVEYGQSYNRSMSSVYTVVKKVSNARRVGRGWIVPSHTTSDPVWPNSTGDTLTHLQVLMEDGSGVYLCFFCFDREVDKRVLARHEGAILIPDSKHCPLKREWHGRVDVIEAVRHILGV